MAIKQFYNRDISWLSFNHRVLQEAADPNVPLYERLKFLAIFSSNLEEFYRIRVAEWRRLVLLTKKTKKELPENPRTLLQKIHKIVIKHQQQLENIFRHQIIKELHARKIRLLDEKKLNKEQKKFVREYFREFVAPIVKPVFIKEGKVPEIEERSIYLAVKLCDYDLPGPRVYEHALVEIPSSKLSRFIVLPQKDGIRFVMILGDVMRFCIKEIFPEYELVESYSIKLTRDAELYLEDEFSGSLLKKIKKGIHARSKGAPTRLLYDSSMPDDFLKHLRKVFDITPLDLLPGGRYHKLSDLHNFPVLDKKGLFYDPLPCIKLPAADARKSMFELIARRDILLHFPYQCFDPVIRFLAEAAEDKHVKSIKITLYRLAEDSQIIKALLKAVDNGISVTVFMELKARFDEEANISSAKELEHAGAHILYSFPILKVHSKAICIERKEQDKIRRYVYLGTGNFNESTARLYSDFGLFTQERVLTREVANVFDILKDTRIKSEFNQLLVAPDHMRHDLITLIDQEIKNALKKRPALIFLKLNSLQDRRMIEKLYEASREGVEVKLIVRGICCLVPGIKGLSENIKVISIVDRFLEHSRVYIFGNDGKHKVYLSSADWMERNLSRRFEIGFPVNHPELKKEVIDIMNIQWKDNTKARMINKIQNNPFQKSKATNRHRSQLEIYQYLKKKHG